MAADLFSAIGMRSSVSKLHEARADFPRKWDFTLH